MGFGDKLGVQAILKSYRKKRQRIQKQRKPKSTKEQIGFIKLASSVDANGSLKAKEKQQNSVPVLQRKDDREAARPKHSDNDFISMESTMHSDELVVPELPKPGGRPPWAVRRYKGILPCRLHAELVDFVKYHSLSADEESARLVVLGRVRKAARDVFADEVKVDIFGSFATGVSLPLGDVDIVVSCTGREPIPALRLLAKRLMADKVLTSIDTITRARIPIIKGQDTLTGLAVDISFNVADGLLHVEQAVRTLRQFPALKPLLIFLKCLLKSRGLNEVYRGGLGSFTLFVLVLSFLRLYGQNFAQPTVPQPKHSEFGILLLDFLRFYGMMFNNREVGIDARTWTYFRRSDGDSQQLLSIFDPQGRESGGKDIGGPAFNYGRIKMVLEHVFLTFCRYHDKQPKGDLLNRVLPGYDPEMASKRAAVAQSGRDHIEDARPFLTELAAAASGAELRNSLVSKSRTSRTKSLKTDEAARKIRRKSRVAVQELADDDGMQLNIAHSSPNLAPAGGGAGMGLDMGLDDVASVDSLSDGEEAGGVLSGGGSGNEDYGGSVPPSSSDEDDMAKDKAMHRW